MLLQLLLLHTYILQLSLQSCYISPIYHPYLHSNLTSLPTYIHCCYHCCHTLLLSLLSQLLLLHTVVVVVAHDAPVGPNYCSLFLLTTMYQNIISIASRRVQIQNCFKSNPVLFTFCFVQKRNNTRTTFVVRGRAANIHFITGAKAIHGSLQDRIGDTKCPTRFVNGFQYYLP